jgi:hypothetical protein
MTIQSTIQIVLGILSCVLSLYLVFHAEWDLYKAIRELVEEKKRIDRIIASLH